MSKRERNFRFFADSISGDTVTLSGDNHSHLSISLRARPGDTVTVCDGYGTDYICMVESISKNETVLKIEERILNEAEPTLKVTLYQAHLKGDKAEFIIQKAVELGIYEIVFFESANCVSRIEKEKEKSKLNRYSTVALTAAKQCGRGTVPCVRILKNESGPKLGVQGSFAAALEEMTQFENRCMFYEGEKNYGLKEVIKSVMGTSFAFMIGPEGGFDESEARYSASHGVRTGSLGKRILKAETAPLFALSALMYEIEN